MKKYVLIAILFGIQIVFATAKTKIVGALDPTYPPFEYYEKGISEIVGVDVDMVKAIAEELGYEVEIQDMSYGGIMPALLAGKLDFIASPITITDERKKNVNFSQPTSAANLTILVNKSNKDIKDFADLKGKRIGAKTGTISSTTAHKIEKAVVTDFDSGANMIIALITNKIDAVIDENLVNDYLIKSPESDAKDKVKVVGKPFNDKIYAFAISKKQPQLAKDFDKAIKSLKKQGKWQAIIDKWFANDYVKKGAFVK
ncbi:MAG: basic amino acid ABC transporter substrate-binding protein [Rickettsiales bacterium]|nr:MAG: basic amino acid ABC transporter substrate-binding protein [Rickettsiales bacterium]